MRPHEVTQGCTDAELGPRQNVVPFDEYDGIRQCARCGRQAEYPEVHRTITVDDRIEMRCADVHSCLKRRPRT